MNDGKEPEVKSPLDKLIWFCLNNKLVVVLFLFMVLAWGMIVAPFDWELGGIPRDPVPVDAIPDIGENQQIVFTTWMGRSPQDIEDQVSYPLTTSLLGIPGVKTIRSYSFFGFSSIYVIFKEDVDFYWSRSRILEKLNSLPAGTLPSEVRPSLGPDATALGQIFWYTLEGRDALGNPTGGWDPQELRSVQDWYLRYALMSADGVSEVASVGGFVQEYQVDVDPDAMRAHAVNLHQVFDAVRQTNIDVGARNIEVNNVEYFIRGLGFIKSVEDIENAVIKVNQNVPICVKDVAHVSLGPEQRRGALDKGGAGAVGGVVVVRYGENPLEVIQNVKDKIAQVSPGLPRKTLEDGTVSQVTVVPFYDRTGLIHETLGTLKTALSHEILVTIIVVLLMLLHFRSSLLISGLLPVAVLMTFIAMKVFGVDANVVALSGIAIAIGTMVDMGVVVVESIVKNQETADPSEKWLHVVYRATREVGGAVITAVSTTIISFLPVFTMVAAEGKLFRPLAFTKTFALIASIVIAIVVIPPFAQLMLGKRKGSSWWDGLVDLFPAFIIVGVGFIHSWWVGLMLLLWCILQFGTRYIPAKLKKWNPLVTSAALALIVAVLLSEEWMPLGPEKGFALNGVFVMILIGGILGFFTLFQWLFPRILRWALSHRFIFLCVPSSIVLVGAMVWLGFDSIFGWVPDAVKRSAPVSAIAHRFPGLGKEFMPPLDEGSYLYMPTTSVHASIDEVIDIMSIQDRRISSIPEVDMAVGKLGRAETPLDPAPISMIETVINYKSEYIVDASGKRLKFQFDADENDLIRDANGEPVNAADGLPYYAEGRFARDERNQLIPDTRGVPFRQWRPPLDPDLNEGREAWAGISSPDEIWDQIIRAAKVPGTTSAPKLQPIAARIVMLQSGMRAPMGIKVMGPSLKTIEDVGLQIEKFLKQVPSIEASAVVADRIIGKPYLEIEIDRNAIARYGIKINELQQVIEVAIGGKHITSTVEGRERYPVRVRYLRELRNTLDTLHKILVPATGGVQIPLAELAKIKYAAGAQVIKSEDTFLVSYVIFDKKEGTAEVDVVQQAQKFLEEKMATGEFIVPAGVNYRFAGSYENQLRAAKKLTVVLPLALFIIFVILYFQFRSVSTTLLVFTGIAVAWAGGFLMIWCYGQPWFLDFSVFGTSMRDLFQVDTINLSVAIWVGFLALFGIATDDGVIIATYLNQVFEERQPETVEEIRSATIEASSRRIRPALMTVATTVIALIPVLTSTGRGSDIMVPMAIPTFGGMTIVIFTIFVVPVLYSYLHEFKIKRTKTLIK